MPRLDESNKALIREEELKEFVDTEA